MAFDSDDDDFSGTDSDEGFQADMEALKKACLLSGKDADDLQPSSSSADGHVAGANDVTLSDTTLMRVRMMTLSWCVVYKSDLPLSTEVHDPINMKPLCSILPPGSEGDEDDDFETLRVIQRRFAAYGDDNGNGREESLFDKFEQVGVTNITSEKETSNNLFVETTNAEEGFPACVDRTIQISEECSNDVARSKNLTDGHDSGAETTAISVNSSRFPKSAHAFVDAIKKNRACQKLIREKMMQTEARLEELKKLKERVKILKSFQLTCKKKMGRALSQKRDARVQLISLPKQRFSAKLPGKKLSAIHSGPPENSHVASFKEALTQFAVSLSRKDWSKEESENLAKGVKQQFQEMLLQRSVNLPVNLLSDEDGCSRESGDLDDVIASIRDHKITPETMRSFIPEVNWDQVASMYLPGRSGGECQSRWLNWEDPLIKHEGWDLSEEKNLLQVVQQKRMSNWVDIAASLGVSRTPFQCLSHYQRSLNASIIRGDWTDEEDSRLCAAVETFGESNWQVVASVIEGRTGSQCSNRWIKSLHPARRRCGKWSADEDKRLKVAVMLFYPKCWRNIGQSVPWRTPVWKKVAQYVPGRTHVQCRERWVNTLDPSLKLDEWTEEEDLKLKSAINEHGYSWSKVAACVPSRTDNQCRRRWMVLFPDEVPMLKEAKKIRREAFISNFVDREEERPALKPNDIVLAHKLSKAGCETTTANKKRKRRPRTAKDDKSPKCDAVREMEKQHSEGSEGPESSDLIKQPGEKNKRRFRRHPRNTKKVKPNDKVPEASASSAGESTVADDNICKRRRTSLLVKKKSRTITSASITVDSTIADGNSCKRRQRTSSQVKKKSSDKNARRLETSAVPGTLGGGTSGASVRHKLNKCNRLKNDDRSCVGNLPETVDDCMTLASFVRKSRAKGCSLSFTKVARLHPDKAQGKAMAGDHSSRSCISGGHDETEKRTSQECTSSNQISGTEVGDDMPLSLFMGKVKREKIEVGDGMPLAFFIGKVKRGQPSGAQDRKRK
ncbi:hypothetical protein P3S67_030729 [Capsicum chacoense]